jgi:hypothetical protein
LFFVFVLLKKRVAVGARGNLAFFRRDFQHAVRDAWELWMRPSVTRPVRPDGQPNRPLTAFSIVLRPLRPFTDL